MTEPIRTLPVDAPADPRRRVSADGPTPEAPSETLPRSSGELRAAKDETRRIARARRVAPSERLSRSLLVMSDVIAFAVSVYLGLWTHINVFNGASFGWGTVGAGLAWLTVRAGVRLHAPEGMASPEEFRRDVSSTLLVGGTHALTVTAQHLANPSRTAFVATWIFLLPVSLVIRGIVKRIIAQRGIYGRPVVVLGAGSAGRAIVHELQTNPLIGLTPVAVFDDDSQKIGGELLGVPIVGRVKDADRFPYEVPVRDAILALPRLPRPEFLALTRRLSERFEHLRVIPDLLGIINLWVQPGSLGSSLTLEMRHDRFDANSRRVKRAFDLIVGMPLFLATLPIVVLACLLVKLISPGPALFSQEREGQGGRRIRVWKIRTMVPDAEEMLRHHLSTDAAARAEWDAEAKLRNDPRIIPGIGRFFRKASIDELPQLWSVLSGELSLVGPRVSADYQLERWDQTFRALRQEVKPGITGYWQVTNRINGDAAVKQAADTYYIHNWSIWLDLWILSRTVAVVLSGKGAY